MSTKGVMLRAKCFTWEGALLKTCIVRLLRIQSSHQQQSTVTRTVAHTCRVFVVLHIDHEITALEAQLADSMVQNRSSLA